MIKKQQNSSYNSRDRDRVFIPASTHRAVFGRDRISNIVYRVNDPTLADAAETKVYATLARKKGFDATDEDAIEIWDTREFDTFLGYFFVGFNVFMGIVGSFTLTVGGIGVANIMYVVVRERTREIGIRRSLGATRRSILLGFLVETLLIVAAGALMGFLISIGIVALLGLIPIQEFVGRPTISPLVALSTIALLGGIALAAGFFPARKAAGLDPVECLRHGV
jgi:putative ABC transport system permease protein